MAESGRRGDRGQKSSIPIRCDGVLESVSCTVSAHILLLVAKTRYHIVVFSWKLVVGFITNFYGCRGEQVVCSPHGYSYVGT